MSKSVHLTLVAVATMACSVTAHADIKVGVVLSETGPAASLGIPEQKTVRLFPKQIGGQNIQYIIRDDASDPTAAVKAAKELIDADNVDIVVGPTVTPCSLAMIPVVGAAKTPNVSLAAGWTIVHPVVGDRKWVFTTPQTTLLMAQAVVENMVKNKFKRVAFIGFDDAYGEDWWNNFSKDAEAAGIQVMASERYSHTATSVTGQILHILAAKPEAVLIAASGTPAALPERELRKVGYKGQIYQTHGVANPDFLRVCGTDCDGTLLPVAPGLVADQLSANNPIKPSGMRFATAYTTAYGKNSVSQFSANAWDAITLLESSIPVALKHAKPEDTVAFRVALRNALENLKDIPGADGIYSMSPTDHNGLDKRAVVMVRIEHGTWTLLK